MTDDAMPVLVQHAPYPTILASLVSRLRYRTGWRVWLEDVQRDEDHGRGTAGGLTLVIRTKTSNSYHEHACEFCNSPVTDYAVHHYFIVPAATYGERAWRRWLLDRLIDVETHEACEYFTLMESGTYSKPFAPHHGPGEDPYTIFETGTEEEARTTFRGTVAPVPNCTCHGDLSLYCPAHNQTGLAGIVS